MNVEAYLLRIKVTKDKVCSDLENLRRLQRQHLLHIPFENLDIHWGNNIILDEERIYEKVIGGKRGGFCYELNGLFYCLLEALLFNSIRLSAKVYIAEGKFGEEFDHLLIMTEIEEEHYIVDVGFGDFAATPLRFVLDQEQIDSNGIFLIRKFTDRYFEIVKKEKGSFVSQYIFSLKKRKFSEFEKMCFYHQRSNKSTFTQKKVCSMMTPTGRKTLTDKTFTETIEGEKREKKIANERDFRKILKREFNIEQ